MTTTKPTTASGATAADRLRARIAARTRDDRGMAVLDVLLFMAIFVLIAIVGINGLGAVRRRAQETAAETSGSTATTSGSTSSDVASSFPIMEALAATGFVVMLIGIGFLIMRAMKDDETEQTDDTSTNETDETDAAYAAYEPTGESEAPVDDESPYAA